ncbi:MAG TPA: fused MFS/spermidine synthase [bacterium]
MSDRGELKRVLRWVALCYFLSGALGLVYQVLWLRKLMLVFGSTVYAVSTVLTVFFGGLALGSWLLGRYIDRHGDAGLRIYAYLELGIGAYAFLTPWLFEAIQHLYIPVYRSSGLSTSVLVSAAFGLSLAILLLPTTLMGGTFPVLSRFLIRSSEERGVRIADLYGLNTAGAMTGTLGVYFIGLPVLGVLRTLWCAGVTNLGIGVLCLIFDRHLESLGFRRQAASAPPAAAAEPTPASERGDVRWLLLAFGLSGFAAIAYEVVWTRALGLVLGSSIYAFCIILATYLGGMALGSFYARGTLERTPATIRRFIVIEVLLAACGLIAVMLFRQLPEWLVNLWPLFGQTFATLTWLQFLLSASVIIIPTLLMGYLFPVVSDLVTRRFSQLGQRLGAAYAINTLGGIAGSFLTGFALIPVFGLAWAAVTAALVNLVAAGLMYLRFEGGPGWRRVAVAALSGGLAIAVSTELVIPSWEARVVTAGAYMDPENFRESSVRQVASRAQLLYYKDGLNTTVSVHQSDGVLYLKVGGKTDASNRLDMSTQVLSAHVPLLLHPDPESVLVIGLGSGITFGHASRYPVSRLDCAEIEEGVVEGARWFGDYNYHVHDDPRATIHIADGRNILLASPRRYDVITCEPSNPWMAGIANLFTKEFYELAKRRLEPGGIMCQWVHLYHMFPQDVKLVLRTFREVFPHMTVWCTIPGDLLLVGSDSPLSLDRDRIAARMEDPKIAESLRAAKIDRPELFFQALWLDQRAIDMVTSDVTWLHEDDLPSLEFSAPKALYASGMLSANYKGLERFRVDPKSVVRGYDTARETADFYRALAGLWEFRDESSRAMEAWEKAVELEPSSVEAWSRLGELLMGSQKFPKAERALERAAELDPADVMSRRLLGRVAWKHGEPETAGRWYGQAAAIRPAEMSFAHELGDFYRDQRDHTRAAEYYRSSMTQGGGDRLEVVLGYAQALRELEAWADAEALLRFGMLRYPGQAAMPMLLGKTLIDLGRFREAESLFRHTLMLAPNASEAFYELAQCALERGSPEDAMRYLKRTLGASPYHEGALKLLYEAGRESSAAARLTGE